MPHSVATILLIVFALFTQACHGNAAHLKPNKAASTDARRPVPTLRPSDLRGFGTSLTATDKDIADAAKMGANTLRLVLMAGMTHSFDDFRSPMIPQGTISAAKLDTIQKWVDTANYHGIHVVICPAEFPGLVRWSTYDSYPYGKYAATDKVWSGDGDGPAYRDMVAKMWLSIAERFKGYPRNYVSFELMNEPQPGDHKIWDDLQDRLITEIRKVDRSHPIIAAYPHNWGVKDLAGWNPSLTVQQDRNISVAFHFYHPHEITFLRDVNWREIPATAIAYPTGPFTGHGLFPSGNGREIMTKAFDIVRDFQRRYPKIALVITEGAIERHAMGAEVWAADFINEMRRLRIGWIYWGYRWIPSVGIAPENDDSNMFSIEMGTPALKEAIVRGFAR